MMLTKQQLIQVKYHLTTQRCLTNYNNHFPTNSEYKEEFLAMSKMSKKDYHTQYDTV